MRDPDLSSGSGQGQPPRLAALLLRLVPAADREFIAGDLEERFARMIERGVRAATARRLYWRHVVASVWTIAADRVRVRRRGGPRATASCGGGAGVFPAAARGRDVTTRSRGRIARLLDGSGGVAADARFAVRALRKRPGHAGLAVSTLALGIGATTAVFSIANAILLRPLPGIADPDGIAIIEFVAERGRDRSTGVSLPDLEMLRGVSGFAGLAGNATVSLQVMTPAGDAFAAVGEAVAGEWFESLGVRPSHGRLLSADELRLGADPSVAVISEAFHARVFGGDPDVIGRTLRVNNQSLTIVGVTGGGFGGTELRRPVEVWVPIAAYTSLRHLGSYDLNRPGRSFFQQLIGRLADGVTAEAAQAELRGIFEGLAEQQPDVYDEYAEFLPTVYAGVGIEPFIRDRTAGAIGLMFAVVALVMLIACANVANLLLFRGVHRRGELAVRRALGASGGRVARQSLIESLMLGLGGALAGLLVAHWTMTLLGGTAMVRLPAFESFTPDARVLAFAAAAAVFTALAFGAAPAVLASRADPAGALRESGATERRTRLRTGLSAFQLALSMTLLVSAFLLLRTVRNLYAVDPGYDPSATTAFMIDPEPQGYEDADALALWDRLLDRVRSIRGIESVSISTHPPFVGARAGTSVRAPDSDQSIGVEVDFIAPGFFATLGVPVLRGREFTPADIASGGAVIIDESLSRRLFGGADPVGRSLAGRFFDGGERIIVGVVADIAYRAPGADAGPAIFEPLSRSYTTSGFLLVRGNAPPAELRAAVLETVKEVDPAIPVPTVQYLSDGLDEQLAEQTMFARLLTAFAAVALFLSAVGLYGLIGHSVARRTREIGVRVALGAWRGRVIALVLREAALVAAIGIAFGLAGALAFGRLIESRLFGVTSTDPATWLLAACVLAAATFAATLSPALAAVRVDPVRALRSE